LVHLNRIIEDVLVHTYKADQLQTYPRCDEMFFEMFGYDRAHLVQLRNAVSPELSYLRPSLIPNLLLAVAKNSQIYPSLTLFDSGLTRNKSERFSRYLNKQSFETTKL
jgi:phenylalanyl-tRNA synthetase beta subunit